jgi:magnesium-transporting ATPase (P-type)
MRPEEIEKNIVFVGLFGICDQLRENVGFSLFFPEFSKNFQVPDSITQLHEAGIDVIMITGDGLEIAKAIVSDARSLDSAEENAADCR